MLTIPDSWGRSDRGNTLSREGKADVAFYGVYLTRPLLMVEHKGPVALQMQMPQRLCTL